MLRIQPAAGIELERVLVAIHGDLSGMLERSLATPNPITGDWHYMRKTNHPPREGAILEITAVPAGGLPPTLLIIEQRCGKLTLLIRGGGKARRLVLWEEIPGILLAAPRSVVISVSAPAPLLSLLTLNP